MTAAAQPDIPTWIAAEIDAGRDDFLRLMDAAPFPSTGVRTVAEDGDFEILNEGGRLRVARVDKPAFSWFPANDPGLVDLGSGAWGVPVTVTEELLDGGEVTVPRALAAQFAVPRMSQVPLSSAKSAQLLALHDDRALTGPVDRFLEGYAPGDEILLVFGTADQSFEVRPRQ